ncbi:MAG: hypothetical protein JST14_11565 [Bacteroidetes bacterium]|nr:hypothetical protein [Bacteroidota bacterium]
MYEVMDQSRPATSYALGVVGNGFINRGPKMRLLAIFTFGIWLSANGQGQINPKLNDETLRETIIREYLLLDYDLTHQEIQRLKLNLRQIPYQIGDTFTIKDTLIILNHYNDSTIIFDTDKNSIVPPGYKIKLVKETGDMYFVECKNDKKDIKRGFVMMDALQDYFFPENIETRGRLYKTLMRGDEQIKKYISKKYAISTLDLITIVENAGYRLRNNR